MIVKYTKSEKAKIQALEEKYSKLISDCEIIINKRTDDLDPDGSKEAAIAAKRLPEPIELRPQPINYTKEGNPVYDKAELAAYKSTPEYKAYIESNVQANKEMTAFFNEWEAKGSEEWKKARRDRLKYMDELNDGRRRLYRQFEKRQFSELGGDPDRILKDAKNQITQLIKNRYDSAKKMKEEGNSFSIFYLRIDGERLYIDAQQLIEDSKELLHLHYDFFKDDPENISAIRTIVLDSIADSPYTGSKGILGGNVNGAPLPGGPPIRSKDITNIPTRAPKQWLTPIDKVSNLAFNGEGNFYRSDGKFIGADISNRKTKKEILSLVNINYDDKDLQISGNRSLTPYDREVHDALTTLFVDGENDYITPRMIYRAMTGNENASLSTKRQESISNSMNKLMYTRIKLEASEEECAAYGFDSYKYEGTIIQGEKVTATLAVNGKEVLEVYHLLREPVLYTYAAKKSQIARLDIKLLNSPVNKNEENIILQSYLCRRILAMKGSSKLSPTIVYDTVYKYLGVSAASDGALRKKKLKVRSTTHRILDYLKEQEFIGGYVENSRKNEIVSVTIRL